VLSNIVADYGSPARAAEVLAGVRETIEACGDVESDTGSYELEETAGPNLGDDSVGATLTGSGPFEGLHGQVVYVRVADRVVGMALVDFEPVDDELLEDAAGTVVDRL
jgi:hypothetical protein